jgi:hypothetical protein
MLGKEQHLPGNTAMTYEVILLNSDIRGPMIGAFRLGLVYDGEQQAELEYHWDETRFTAVFHGHAPGLPVPAHPSILLQKPIAAIYALKTDEHALPTDVFRVHRVTIDIDS